MSHFSDGVRVGANFDNNGSAAEPGAQTLPVFVYNVVPTTLSTTAVAVAQAVAGAGNLTINGTTATSSVATFDVARGVQILSTNAGDTTQIATVTGKDVYGVPVSEAITFSGTTAVLGKKAFKTVTRVAISAALTGNASVGNTDILGLPYVEASRGYVLTAWDDAFVTTGTFVAAVATSPATTTTGDVRGTFTPPTASNSTRRLTAWMFVFNPDTRIGLYGVTQA